MYEDSTTTTWKINTIPFTDPGNQGQAEAKAKVIMDEITEQKERIARANERTDNPGLKWTEFDAALPTDPGWEVRVSTTGGAPFLYYYNKQTQQTQDPVGSYAPPKADKVININGYNYHWADQRWTREDGKVITNPDGIQTLNKASYSVDAPGNVNTQKTPKPKVPYSVIQQQQNQNQEQISPAPNAGAPTADEQANLQAKLQAAMAKQNQGV